MDLRHIHPDVLHRWAEEVLHLHSLWHLGPPQTRNPNPVSGHSLRPETSTAFKRKAKKRKKKNVVKPTRSEDPPPPTAGAEEVEWPTVPAAYSKPPPATWNDLAPPPAPTTLLPVSAEEQARADAANAQRNGLKASEEFFSKDGSDEDSDGDDQMDDGDEEKDASFEFFLQLFEKDANLREYYEKNYERGWFSCLVCSGTGVKKWKRYGDGVALVQHANSVSKSIQEHRAFARAVYQVLGWDIDRLPAIMPTTREERLHKEGDIDEKEDKVDRLDLVTELSDVDKLEWPSALTRKPNPSTTTRSDLTPPPVAVAQHLASAGEQIHAVVAQENGLNVDKNLSSESNDLDDNVEKHSISLMQKIVYKGHTKEKENEEDQMEVISIKEIEIPDAHEVEQQSVPTTNAKTSSSHVLRLENSTAFKKKTNERKKKVVKSPCSDDLPGSHDPPPSTMGADQVEWPTAPAADSKPPPATWNDLAPPPVPPTLLPMSLEEQACMDATKAQRNGLKASEEFFSKEDGSDNDSDGDDYMDVVGEEKNRHFDFFLQLFEKDGELREYYEKNHGRGGFSCLVCSGTGVKKWKKYSNGVSLVQHANSIKSKSLQEHRAFARAICQVLDWNIDRLPGPSTTKALGHSSSKSAVMEEEKDLINKNEDIQEISESCSHEDVAGSSVNMAAEKYPVDNNKDIQKEISESCNHEDTVGFSENMTTNEHATESGCQHSSGSKVMEDNNMKMMKIEQELGV